MFWVNDSQQRRNIHGSATIFNLNVLLNVRFAAHVIADVDVLYILSEKPTTEKSINDITFIFILLN